MLTQNELKSFAHYDPDTGVMTRTKKTGNFCGVVGEEIGHSARYAGHGLEYRGFSWKNHHFFVHRAAFLYMTGEWPKGDIDHIDGNGLNNKWSNLRVVEKVLNSRNRKLNKNSSTGVLGVSWVTSRKEYRAAINIEPGKKKTLGYFKDFNEAVACRKAAEAANDYHPNHGRKSA